MRRANDPELGATPPAWPAPHAFCNERLWLDYLLEREILRLRARYQLSLDELRGLYISDRQVDELLRRQAKQFAEGDGDATIAQGAFVHDPAAALTRQAAQWREHFAPRSSLALLGERFELSEADLELVFVAFAPELDLRYETLYAYLNNDISRKSATVDMARRLLDGDDAPDDSTGLRGRIPALIAAGIFDAPGIDDRRSSLGESLTLARPVAQFLLGIPPMTRVEACCGSACEPQLEPVAATGTRTAPATAHGDLIACRGDDADRQAYWATQLLAARGRHGLHVAPAALVAGDEPTLLARLAGAALILHEPACASRDPADAERLAAALQRATDAGLLMLWLVPRGWQPSHAFGQLPLTTLDLPPANAKERAANWADALRRSHLSDAAESVDALASSLANRFSIAGTRVRLAVHSAQALLDADPTISDSREALERTARQLAAQTLAQVAQHATKPHRWPQLVLPSTTLQLLHEIASAIVSREQVFRTWNMQGRTGRSAGLMLLFTGVSGTGKTMAASVIANHVGLELFRIDLAGVISKYIGETEKNLDRIFTAAHDADAILLFDEADALLGKRAEVKDAHDRYANIEVAYLLQKMEEHDGVVILASNLPKNLDQAFSRRMHYVVEFSRPNAALRDQLWRGIYPAEVPLANDINYPFLAEQFELTGGDIQTIALEAAFLAAGEGKPVGMAQLMRALSRRQTKHGDSGVAARFRVYQDTIERGRG